MSNIKITIILSSLFISSLIVSTLPAKDEVVIPTRAVPTNSPVPLNIKGQRSVNDILPTTWEPNTSNSVRRSREILALYESFCEHFINIYTGISKSNYDKVLSDIKAKLDRDTENFISDQKLAAPYISTIQNDENGLNNTDYEAMSQIVENMFLHLQAYIKDLGY